MERPCILDVMFELLNYLTLEPSYLRSTLYKVTKFSYYLSHFELDFLFVLSAFNDRVANWLSEMSFGVRPTWVEGLVPPLAIYVTLCVFYP